MAFCWCFNLFVKFVIIALILAALSYLVGVFSLLYCNDFPRRRKRCRSAAKLNGKTAIVTGANSGIGFETAKDLAKRGARVVLACRNTAKADAVCRQIKDSTGNDNVIVMQCDVSDLDSVQRFCQEFCQNESDLHILVNNAGVGHDPSRTQQGFEKCTATNYVGPFLMTYLLLDKLKSSAPSRVVNVSSMANYACFDLGLQEKDATGLKFPQWTQYFKSKLLSILHIKELARRLEGTGVTTYCLHPGFVLTPLFENIQHQSSIAFYIILTFRWLGLNPDMGAQTSIFCAVDESLSSSSGKYYDNCHEQQPNKLALDNDLARRVWDVTLKSVSEYTKL